MKRKQKENDKMEEINKAFSEVYDIINHLNKDLYKKVPSKFIQIIEKNRDLDYKVNIDYRKSIIEQELLKDTRVILSLMYRDYICTPEERKELLIKDRKEMEEEEKILRDKYEINFQKRNENLNDAKKNEEQNVAISIVKEKWYQKLFNLIFRRR